MNPDEHHVALPKLYGAPAYARPPRVFEEIDRPPDPDDLPLEAFRDDEGTTPPASMTPFLPANDVPADRPAVVDEPTDGPSDDPVPAGPPEGDSESAQGVPPALRPRQFSVRALSRFLQRH